MSHFALVSWKNLVWDPRRKFLLDMKLVSDHFSLFLLVVLNKFSSPFAKTWLRLTISENDFIKILTRGKEKRGKDKDTL